MGKKKPSFMEFMDKLIMILSAAEFGNNKIVCNTCGKTRPSFHSMAVHERTHKRSKTTN